MKLLEEGGPIVAAGAGGGAAAAGPPRIGIDVHGLSAVRTGVENYVSYLVAAMARQEPPEDVGLYLHSPPAEQLPFRTVTVPRTPLWTSVRLPLHFTAHGAPRVMLHPAHSIPLFGRPATVATIHDLAFEFFPDHFTYGDRLRLRAVTRHAVRKADAIIAVSRSARDDLVNVLGVPEERIRVVHHGRHPTLREPADAEVAQVRRAHRLERPYVLTVGTCQARKNHATLIRALPHLHRRGLDVDLVIAGGRGWLYEPTRRLVDEMGLGERVRFLGYVPAEHLAGLYGGAEAVAIVSLYEGFGLPVLEALACGRPTLVSNVSSLPEVGGDAVLMVDPQSTEAVAEGLRRLLCDDQLRGDLRSRIPANLARFSWDRSARETLRLLREFT